MTFTYKWLISPDLTSKLQTLSCVKAEILCANYLAAKLWLESFLQKLFLSVKSFLIRMKALPPQVIPDLYMEHLFL